MIELSYEDLIPQRDWIFFHDLHPMPDQLRRQIRRLTEDSAKLLWSEVVRPSKPATCYRNLPSGHWIQNLTLEGPNWYEEWNNPDAPSLVAPFLAEHLMWEEEEEIFFIRANEYAISTYWGVFLLCWKAFLFNEDGPFVLNLKHKEFIFFANRGFMAIGLRTDL